MLQTPRTWRGHGPREEARGRSGPVPGPGLVQPGQRKFPLRTPNPDSEVGPEAGPYLRELSDETSRSESSVSLGGGGGSLSGAAGKAGDFLEKNTSCHLGAGRTLVRLALRPLGLVLW